MTAEIRWTDRPTGRPARLDWDDGIAGGEPTAVALLVTVEAQEGTVVSVTPSGPTVPADPDEFWTVAALVGLRADGPVSITGDPPPFPEKWRVPRGVVS